MSVESAIFDALRGFVNDRVYPDVAPKEVFALPRITYQQVGGQGVNFLDPSIPSKKNGRFQINVWAATRLQAAALARDAEDALRMVPTLQATVLGAAVAVYEADTELYGTRQDFSCWF